MTLDNVQALPAGTRLGDYRLDAVIGHGGFGITYRAFDSQLAKIVAIKEYLPVEFAIRGKDGVVTPRGTRFADDFTWGRERFLDEARALARFRHAHIVPVMRFLVANGTAYTVMEFEDGRSVAQLLHESGRRMPPDEVRRLAQALLSGLAAIHAEGFLHRDIKPSNIIIRHDGVPVLIDFGAARQAVGGRTRTLTSVLTPQYAPIEQYTAGGGQGAWSDIYSAAAVLHCAVAGQPPPEAAARVGKDPYRPLTRTQADRFDELFLNAIDHALAFAPEERPQNVNAWRVLFGPTLPLAEDPPTERLSASPALTALMPDPVLPASEMPPTLRLKGVKRGEEVVPPLPPRRRAWTKVLGVVVVLAAIGGALWRYQTPVRQFMAQVPQLQELMKTSQPSSPPNQLPLATTPGGRPTSTNAAALVDQAQRVASEARRVAGLATDAASAARTMAGEARIAAARAARPGLENVERVTSEDASYVGQSAEGKRQGFGVAELKNGGRQAGEWRAGQLNGLATERLADGARYEGQWREGQSTGYGVRERPGVERFEGSFIAGRLEGVGLRRALAAPNTVQAGEWHQGSLDGPGVETIGENDRYEGTFRGGKRHGFGQAIGADEKVVSGRWEDGKLVETAP